MRPGKNVVRVTRVERHRPEPAARELHLLGIDPFPFVPGVGRNKYSALRVESAREKYLVRIVRIDKNGRVIAKRKIAAAARPRPAVVTADVERLNSSNINVIGTPPV